MSCSCQHALPTPTAMCCLCNGNFESVIAPQRSSIAISMCVSESHTGVLRPRWWRSQLLRSGRFEDVDTREKTFSFVQGRLTNGKIAALVLLALAAIAALAFGLGFGLADKDDSAGMVHPPLHPLTFAILRIVCIFASCMQRKARRPVCLRVYQHIDVVSFMLFLLCAIPRRSLEATSLVCLCRCQQSNHRQQRHVSRSQPPKHVSTVSDICVVTRRWKYKCAPDRRCHRRPDAHRHHIASATTRASCVRRCWRAATC